MNQSKILNIVYYKYSRGCEKSHTFFTAPVFLYYYLNNTKTVFLYYHLKFTKTVFQDYHLNNTKTVFQYYHLNYTKTIKGDDFKFFKKEACPGKGGVGGKRRTSQLRYRFPPTPFGGVPFRLPEPAKKSFCISFAKDNPEC